MSGVLRMQHAEREAEFFVCAMRVGRPMGGMGEVAGRIYYMVTLGVCARLTLLHLAVSRLSRSLSLSLSRSHEYTGRSMNGNK